MGKYAYLFFSLYLLFVWLIFFWRLKKESRKILIKISIAGSVAGLIAEIWYYKDYWHPPTLFNNTKVSLEDLLFGFAFTGIAATIYEVILKKESEKYRKGHKIIFIILFFTGIFSLLLFNNLLKINSVIVTTLEFLTFAFIMVLIRKDLAMRFIMSGILSLLLMIPIYVLLFDFLFPAYWDEHWLLVDTTFGMRAIDNIPVLELFWYFSWGCLAGIVYDFYYGSKGKASG